MIEIIPGMINLTPRGIIIGLVCLIVALFMTWMVRVWVTRR